MLIDPQELAATPDADATRTEADRTFSRIFEESWGWVVAYMERDLTLQSDAEDLAEEVFAVVLDALRRGKTIDNVWIFVTARNIAANARRSRARATRLRRALEPMVAEGAPEPGIELLPVRDAIFRLPAREREALTLTYWDGLAASEVAQVMHSSPAAVWKLISRARQKLQRMLNVEGES